MKKLLTICTFIILLLPLSNQANAQTFDLSTWRKQYDPVYSKNDCVVFVFGYDKATYIMKDMTTGEQVEAEGTYSTRNDSLFLSFPGAYLAFSVKWINKNKVEISNAPGRKFYLSVMNSKEDTYIHDYVEANYTDK